MRSLTYQKKIKLKLAIFRKKQKDSPIQDFTSNLAMSKSENISDGVFTPNREKIDLLKLQNKIASASCFEKEKNETKNFTFLLLRSIQQMDDAHSLINKVFSNVTDYKKIESMFHLSSYLSFTDPSENLSL